MKSGVCGLHSTESFAASGWSKALPSGPPTYFGGNAVFARTTQHRLNFIGKRWATREE
jgi:hypothetical protein